MLAAAAAAAAATSLDTNRRCSRLGRAGSPKGGRGTSSVHVQVSFFWGWRGGDEEEGFGRLRMAVLGLGTNERTTRCEVNRRQGRRQKSPPGRSPTRPQPVSLLPSFSVAAWVRRTYHVSTRCPASDTHEPPSSQSTHLEQRVETSDVVLVQERRLEVLQLLHHVLLQNQPSKERPHAH